MSSQLRFSKTDAGRAEIRARALALSRAARNLLLVIDAGKTGDEWLKLVQGVSETDLNELLALGLIAAAVTAPPATATAAPAAAAPATPPAAPAPAGYGDPPRLDRAQLYTYLSGEATRLLGTFKGYGFALEVERCNSLQELQALGLQLVERVQRAKGDAAAADVRRALGLI